MALKNRVEKMEQGNKPSSMVIIALLNDSETEDEANARCFPDGSPRPKVVIYANSFDVLI